VVSIPFDIVLWDICISGIWRGVRDDVIPGVPVALMAANHSVRLIPRVMRDDMTMRHVDTVRVVHYLVAERVFFGTLTRNSPIYSCCTTVVRAVTVGEHTYRCLGIVGGHCYLAVYSFCCASYYWAVLN